jgi:hypothetical protein
MRFAPESSSRDENFSALRTDLRQRTPAVAAGILTICALGHVVRKKKARKRNADRRVSNLRTFSGAARAERCALASRRPTTALCQWDYSSQGSTWARLRDTRGQTRRVPRQPVWHFQRCTSRAGPSAGRLMPRPPGCGSDEPPPAGTASRSAMRGHRTTSLYVSEIETPFSNLKHEVKAFRFVLINRDVARRQLKLSRLISRTRFA